MKHYCRALLGAFVALASACMAVEFHVSPAGNDTNRGTGAKPFASIARAQIAARQAKGGTVVVHAGTYYLPATLVFTAGDAGIEYRSANDGKVVLSGGMKLDLTWEPYRDRIMQAKTPAGMKIDQLFVNGRRQFMARYPNYDAKVRPYGGYASDAISTQRVARWSDPAGGFVHALHGSAWGGVHYRITGKNEKGGVTTEGGWQNNRGNGMHEQCRYVENIFEELDAPGEWFHNAKTATLYFYPPEDVALASATMECVRLRRLVEFNGTPQLPVRNVVLRGFTFRHAERTFMDVKEPLLRSDWTIYRGGAVLFNGAEDCAVADCEFDQLGGNAVFVNNYNRRIWIEGCDIHDTGASAVAFVGDPKAVRNPLFNYSQNQNYGDIDKTPGPRTDNYPADCVVEDCLIRGIGMVEKQAAGVQISMASGITVRHCSIYDASRAGINIGDGCWGGHVIEFCDVFDTVMETGDHGSFNSWGRDRYWGLGGIDLNNDQAWETNKAVVLLDAVKTTIIRNSRWRCDHGWDIDLDDGSSNYHIYNNLCLNGGLKNREGFYRVVENNILINGFHPHVWFKHSEDVVRRNIMWSDQYLPAGGMPDTPWGKDMDNNLVHRDGLKDPEPATKLVGQSKRDKHSIVADALFVDPVNGDFRVKDGSPALKLGFVNFPMDQFGVRKAELKKIARTPQLPGSKNISAAAVSAPKPTDNTRYWREAVVRDIKGEEYSAFGVRKDAGGVHLRTVPVVSAAARDGFQTDDLIQNINGAPVKCIADLLRLQNEAAGQPLTIGFVRHQKSGSVSVKRYAYVVAETAAAAEGFKCVPVASADRTVAIRKIEIRPGTNNDRPEILYDGKLADGYGPVFVNGVESGAYKVDLGEVVKIAEINTWSYNLDGRRGTQRFVVFGSNAAENPGWDVNGRLRYTPIAEVDTIGIAPQAFYATSIRATDGQPLGSFRWLLWQAQPVTGSQENTAFQEFQLRGPMKK